MANTKSNWLYSLQPKMEKLCTVRQTWPGADCDGEGQGSLACYSPWNHRVRHQESGLVTEQQQQYHVRFCFIFECIHLGQYYIRMFNKNDKFYSDRGISTWNSPLSSLHSPPTTILLSTQSPVALWWSQHHPSLKSSMDFGSPGSNSYSPCSDSLALHKGKPGTS